MNICSKSALNFKSSFTLRLFFKQNLSKADLQKPAPIVIFVKIPEKGKKTLMPGIGNYHKKSAYQKVNNYLLSVFNAGASKSSIST